MTSQKQKRNMQPDSNAGNSPSKGAFLSDRPEKKQISAQKINLCQSPIDYGNVRIIMHDVEVIPKMLAQLSGEELRLAAKFLEKIIEMRGENGVRVTPVASSEDPLDSMARIFLSAARGDFKSAVVREKTIYDLRHDDEEVVDFIRRIWAEKVAAGEWRSMPEYRGKRSNDGEAVYWVWRVFGTKGFLDGVHFTRTTLSDLAPSAAMRVGNWLMERDAHGQKNKIPPHIRLPAKRGHAKTLVQSLSEVELKAAQSVMSRRAI